MRRTFRSVMVVVFLVATVAVPGVTAWAHDDDPAAAPDPLINPGFEDVLADGHPVAWDVVSEADSVVVRETDTFPGTPKSVTVEPYTESRMLRLGAPKLENESQNRGPNTVRQVFTPTTGTMTAAFALYSWEFRGTDRLVIDLATPEGDRLAGASIDKVSVQLTDRSTATCESLPCTLTISGTKGKLLASDWQEFRLTGLPVGTSVALTYSVVGGDNNSHATWAYFDDVNLAPVARFDVRPSEDDLNSDQASGMPRLEGAPIQLVDTSYDPNGDPITWSWTITGPGLPSGGLTSDAQSPAFIPPDDGDYVVELTVTDSRGLTDTVVDGEDASDGTLVPEVVVDNAPPQVNAVDVEVEPGEPVPVLARFSDAGWTDAHEFAVTQGDTPAADPDQSCQVTDAFDPALLCQEDHLAAMSTGIVRGELPAGTTSGTVTIQDDGSENRLHSDTFGVGIVDADPETTPNSNDLVPDADVLDADGSYLSWLSSAGDIDVFEVELPGDACDGTSAACLLPGTEVLATLSDLPADYDLALVTLPPAQQTAGYQLSGYQLSPYDTAGYQLSGYQLSGYQLSGYQLSAIERAGYQLSPYDTAGYQLSGYQLSGYQLSGYQLSGYQLSPLSGSGYTGLATDDAGGTDLDPGELGIADIVTGDLRLAAFSANRGSDDETALVRVEQPGTRVFAVVFGANGAHSGDDPFRLTLESSVPLNSLYDATDGFGGLFTGICEGTALTGAAPLSYLALDGGWDGAPTGTPSTLIVTQRERLEAAHGMTPAEASAYWADVATLVADPVMNARVVSVSTAGYAGWDTNPCDVDAANAVSDQVRDQIMAELTDGDGQPLEHFEHVVIAGSDDIVPFRRTAIDTPIGDESGYVAGSLLRSGTPLMAAFQAGMTLTDDFYADLLFTPVQGRVTFEPDYGIGRVVETPAEILGALQAFVTSGGSLDPGTAALSAMVSGHDFFYDGAGAAATELSSFATVDGSLITAGDEVPTGELWDADDLRCRWLGVSAPGCNPVEHVPDVAAPYAHYTHYGLISALGFETGDGLDAISSLELADAADGVGSLVFTIGCHAGLSVPDGQAQDIPLNFGVDPALDLAQAFAQQSAVFVGNTGWGFGEDQGIAGTEDLLVRFAEKLGAGVTVGEALRAAKAEYLAAQSTYDVYADKSSVQLTLYGLPMYRIVDGASALQSATVEATADVLGETTLAPALAQESSDGRTWWTADGDVQIVPTRPWQPRVVREVPGDTHGVLVTGGTYTDHSGVTPMITRPTFEWETDDPGTIDSCLSNWWPSELTSLNGPIGPGTRTLVVTPGQFRCDGPGSDGTQRLYPSLTVEPLASSSDDVTPPTAPTFDLRPDGSEVQLSFDASDASGIARIVVLRYHGGTLSAVVDEAYAPPSTAGSFTFALPYATGDEYVVQIADGAGNVTTLTGKGANLHALEVDLAAPELFTPGEPVTFTTTVSGWRDAGPHEVTYEFDLGDGTTETGMLTLSGTSATFDVQLVLEGATDWGERVVTVRIVDDAGGTGGDSVTLWQQCDPRGDVSVAYADLDRCGTRVEATDGGDVLVVRVGIHEAFRSNTTFDPDSQFRLDLDLDGVPGGTSAQLKYTKGSTTGPVPFTVVEHPEQRFLDFRIPLSTLGAGPTIGWSASVQSGIKGAKGEGQLDTMPDTGLRTFDIPSS